MPTISDDDNIQYRGTVRFALSVFQYNILMYLSYIYMREWMCVYIVNSCIFRCTAHVGKRHSSMHLAYGSGACVLMYRSPCAFYSSTVTSASNSIGHKIYFFSSLVCISLSLSLSFFQSIVYEYFFVSLCSFSHWNDRHRKLRLWYCLMCHRVQDQRYGICINLSSCLRIVSNVLDIRGRKMIHRRTIYWPRPIFFLPVWHLHWSLAICLSFVREAGKKTNTCRREKMRAREKIVMFFIKQGNKEGRKIKSSFFLLF